MIIDPKKIVHASSYSSSSGGVVDMELDSLSPSLLAQGKGNKVIFAAILGDNLIIVIGTLAVYEEVQPDPELAKQDVFARIKVYGHSVSISI